MYRTLILLSSIAALFLAPITLANAQNSQEEYGKCGYYADALQGRKTASGEKYDKNQLTCAHKTFPFGTMVRVTRLDNNKSVVVRVNDRGPFIEGYATDISRKAAEAIGLVRDGVTRVKLQVVGSSAATASTSVAAAAKTLPQELEPAQKATTVRTAGTSTAKAQLLKAQKSVPATTVAPVTYSSTAAAAPAIIAPLTTGTAELAAQNVSEVYQIDLKPVKGQGFGLQVAVLTTTENLFEEVAKLQATWPGKVVVNHEEAAGTTTFKLILGAFATKKEAEAQQRKAATKGYKKSFVVEFQ